MLAAQGSLQLLVLESRTHYRQALIAAWNHTAQAHDEPSAVFSEVSSLADGLQHLTFEACILPVIPQDIDHEDSWSHLDAAGYSITYLFHLPIERSAIGLTAGGTATVTVQSVPYLCATRFGSHQQVLAMLQRIDSNVAEMIPAGGENQHERYRKLLNRMSEGFWDVGPDLQIAYANAAFKSICQDPHPVGKNLLDYFDDADRPRLRSILGKQQEGIIIPFTMRLRPHGREKRGKVIQIDPSPRFGWGGQYLGGWALIRDVTDQSADMEQTLRQERELYTLYMVASTLARGFRMTDLVLAATSCMREQLAVDATATWIRTENLDDGTSPLRAIEPRGIEDSPLHPTLVDAALRWCEEMPLNRPAVVVRDTAKSRNPMARGMGEMGFRSIAAIPLMAGKQHIGFLWLACHDASVMTRNWVSLLISIGHQLALAVVNALSVEARLREEARQKQFYRDAVCAITNGKLSLVDRSELTEICADTTLLGELLIRDKEDIQNARKLTEKVLAEQGFADERIFDIATCVSEAATNTLLHGKGGRMSISTTSAERPAGVRIMLEDGGPGINFSELPHAILKRGYSSAVSMGLGYTLILDMMDAVYLATDAQGTALIMEAALNQVNAELEAWLAKVTD